MTTYPISVRVPQQNYTDIQQIATDTGQTVSDVVNEAIGRYLNRAGAGTRTKARLDQLEDQVNRLTIMMVQPQGSKAEQAAGYLEMMDK